MHHIKKFQSYNRNFFIGVFVSAIFVGRVQDGESKKPSKMKVHLNILLVLISVHLVAQKIENNSYINNYFYKDSILYLSDDSAKFSGEFIEYYPGEPKMTGSFKNGLKEGSFIYYDSENKIIKEENYKEGKRHGLFKKYFNVNEITRNLISKEVYSNDSLISGYYWHSSGQILKTIINRDTTLFRFDSSIISIVPYINELKVEYHSSMKYALAKEALCNSIDTLLTIICLIDNGQVEETGYDTIPGSDYKIKSYFMDSPIYLDKAGGDHIDLHSGLIIENNLNNEIKKQLCNLYPAFIYFSRIIILDQYNIEYELNDILILIND